MYVAISLWYQMYEYEEKYRNAFEYKVFFQLYTT